METQGSIPVKVLLVEDDEDNRLLLAEVLAVAGHTVHPAATGTEALRILAEHPVDVVVTDLGLPGMGGLEMARAARQLAPGVPVVLVTGWGDREDVEGARGREVDAVLMKPVDPDALIAVVGKMVARPRGPAS